MRRNYERIGAATGAFFVIAILVGGAMEGGHLQRGPTIVNRVGLIWALLGFAAFLVFVGYLHRVLRRAEGPDGWLATVSLGAGLLYLAIKVGSAAPIVVAGYRIDELTPDLSRTLVDLNDAAFVVSGMMFGLFAVAAAAACLAHMVLPRWLGWFGLASGLLTLAAGIVGVVDPMNYNPMPFLGGLLWTLIASTLLAVRRQRIAQPENESAGRGARAGSVAGP